MSWKNYVIYDGYDATFGFVSPWIDVKNAFAFSISCQFMSDTATKTATPAGTLSLLCSNEPPISAPIGGLVGWLGGSPSGVPSGATVANPFANYGEQPKYNGQDATTITLPVTSVQTVSGTGTVFYDLAQRGFQWVQLKYVSTATGAVRANSIVKW